MVSKVIMETGAANQPTGVIHNRSLKQTTITPFEKVLKESTIKQSDSNRNGTTTTAEDTSAVNGRQSLDSIFQAAAEKYDVPYELLIAVAKAESDFRTEATSGKGAQGIMQLMPATAKALGVTDAYDVKENIMAGAKYLGSHLKAFDGDVEKAVAAYNAGGSAVRKYDGVPPYTETQNYVKIIQNYMKEGVIVPDKMVSVSETSSEAEVSAATRSSSVLEQAVQATEQDLQNSTIVVGTGDSAVTMTYGAYQRYLELGSMGVG